jgi:hypothetical protein
MPIGRLSIRARPGNRLHHLYRNNGDVWWVHYTLNWDGRTRRIRRSLHTKIVDEAVRLRDELFARITAEGEPVPERNAPSRILPLRMHACTRAAEWAFAS